MHMARVTQRRMTPEQLKHYIEKHKEHERKRTSTNDRNKYWRSYFTPSRSETSFDMGKF